MWETSATLDLPPTCTEPGWHSVHCENCEATKDVQALPALGHDYVEGACSRCGESDPDYNPQPSYKTHTVGDVNNDGKVDVMDAQIAFDMSNGSWTSQGSLEAYDKLLAALSNGWDLATLVHAADMNGTDGVTADDARAIQYYVHTNFLNAVA